MAGSSKPTQFKMNVDEFLAAVEAERKRKAHYHKFYFRTPADYVRSVLEGWAGKGAPASTAGDGKGNPVGAALPPLKVPDNPANLAGPAFTEAHGYRFSNDFGYDTFDWCGWKWAVRETNAFTPFFAPQAIYPKTGEGHWLPGAKVLPNGDLELKNKGIEGGVEIILVWSTGYGYYSFEYSGDFNAMHPSNVLGIFPFDWRGWNRGEGYSEIDFIEISRWSELDREHTYGIATIYPDKKIGNVTPEGLSLIHI